MQAYQEEMDTTNARVRVTNAAGGPAGYLVAILFFFTSYEIARDAILAHAAPATVNDLILSRVAPSAMLTFTFSAGNCCRTGCGSCWMPR
jgi:hypothetical protein